MGNQPPKKNMPGKTRMAKPLRSIINNAKREIGTKSDRELINDSFHVGLENAGKNFLAANIHVAAMMPIATEEKSPMNVQNYINKSISDAKTKGCLDITEYGLAILKSTIMNTFLFQKKNNESDKNYLKNVLRNSIYEAVCEIISTELIVEIEDETIRKRKDRILNSVEKEIKKILDEVFKKYGKNLTIKKISENPAQIIKISNQIQENIVNVFKL